jgi:hypothetical protein
MHLIYTEDFSNIAGFSWQWDFYIDGAPGSWMLRAEFTMLEGQDEDEPQEIRPEDVDGIENGAELLDGFRSLLEHELVSGDLSYVNWSDVAENLRPVDESLMTEFLIASGEDE